VAAVNNRSTAFFALAAPGLSGNGSHPAQPLNAESRNSRFFSAFFQPSRPFFSQETM
jgi:hypothetical protein